MRELLVIWLAVCGVCLFLFVLLYLVETRQHKADDVMAVADAVQNSTWDVTDELAYRDEVRQYQEGQS